MVKESENTHTLQIMRRSNRCLFHAITSKVVNIHIPYDLFVEGMQYWPILAILIKIHRNKNGLI